LSCLEAGHPCGPKGYTLSFAVPYCEKFLEVDTWPNITSADRGWIANVRQCLQTAALDFLYGDPVLSCLALEKRAFASHVPCYTEPGFDVCFMPSFWPILYDVVRNDLFNPDLLKNIEAMLLTCYHHVFPPN